jgi:hypothetical protein
MEIKDLNRILTYIKEELSDQRYKIDRYIIIPPKTQEMFSFNDYSKNMQIDFIINLKGEYWSEALIIFEYYRGKISYLKTAYRNQKSYKNKTNDKYLEEMRNKIPNLFMYMKKMILKEKKKK